MVISNIKDLSRLIDLCRKKGIDSVEIDNIKIKLGHLESKKSRKPEIVSDIESDHQLTEEDILNWSVPALDGVG